MIDFTRPLKYKREKKTKTGSSYWTCFWVMSFFCGCLFVMTINNVIDTMTRIVSVEKVEPYQERESSINMWKEVYIKSDSCFTSIYVTDSTFKTISGLNRDVISTTKD